MFNGTTIKQRIVHIKGEMSEAIGIIQVLRNENEKKEREGERVLFLLSRCPAKYATISRSTREYDHSAGGLVPQIRQRELEGEERNCGW